jgi:hypothetical protein
MGRFGVPFSLRGVRYVWAARRGFRASNEPSLAVEGIVTSAFTGGDAFAISSYPSVYIELAVDDDTKLIFRVPGKFAHRVPVGARVRVECLPATEVVTDVTLLEPEGEIDTDT